MQPPVAVKNHVKFALGGMQFEHKEPGYALEVEAREGPQDSRIKCLSPRHIIGNP